MISSKWGMINLETGEIREEGIPVWIGKKAHVGERFFMGFQDTFIELAQDREITAEARRVLDYMMGNLDFENFIQIPQAQIAKDLSMKKPNVSRALKLICDKKILVAGPKIGKSLSYRMNFRYGWKGKVSSLKKLQKSHLDLAVDNT
jgi:hypothetical protein